MATWWSYEPPERIRRPFGEDAYTEYEAPALVDAAGKEDGVGEEDADGEEDDLANVDAGPR
jgi:hypothetical protein